MDSLMEIVMGRKSVRTFDGKRLSEAHLSKLKEYAKSISNPFDIPVEFVFLDAGENGLSSPVLSGEEHYVAGIVPKKPLADVALGYSFEKLVLYAWSLGVGTVWIGGTMKREIFESAAGVKEGEMMPCVSPLGYPADRKSVKESLMRKGVGADARKPFEDIFFCEEWQKPYSPDKDLQDVFEMVRWAPSAVNKQPWRIIVKDGSYNFYEKKDKGYVSEQTGDMQKIDIGIALCHFCMGLEDMGKSPVVTVNDPLIKVPDEVEYIASVSF